MLVDESETFMYSSGDDGVVAQWNLNSPDDNGTGIMQAGRAIYAMTLLPQNRLVAGASDGTLYIVDTDRKTMLKTLQEVSQPIYGLFRDEETDLLWILYGGGKLTLMRSDNLEPVAHIQLTTNHLRCISVDWNKETLLIGASDNRIYRVDRKTGKTHQHWEAHDNSVFSLALLQGGNVLASGGMDAHLKIWDLKNPLKLTKSLPAHYFTVNDIAISPSGTYFATASRDKTWKIWNAFTFDLLKVIDFERYDGHRHSVNRIKWLKTDNSLISCSDDRRIIRWDVAIEQRKNK